MKIIKYFTFILALIFSLNVIYAGSIVFDTYGTIQNAVGYASGTDARFAQSFTATSEVIQNLTFFTRRYGGGFTYNISIQTNASGEPSGTLVEPNALINFDGTAIGTTGANHTANFNTNVSLTAGNQYWLVIERSDGLFDNANGIVIYSNSVDTYAGGHFEREQSGVWADYEKDLRASLGTFVNAPTLTLDNINLVNNTITNSNSLNISLNISILETNSNINTTLYLSNGSSYQIGTNTQNVSYNLTGIQEGTYNIWTYSYNNETNVTSSNYTYTFDFTAPTINNNINDTYYSYTVAFNSSCSDIYLVYCNISVNSQNVALNSSTFTFTSNGNFTYNITASDLAGNIATESNLTFINPLQYWRFVDDLGANVTNFTFGGYNFTEQAAIPIYSLGLGNQSLAFEKDGFITSYFPITLNSTSAYNETYNVFVARIIINVYDQITGNLINGSTLDLDLIGPTTLYSNTTDGTFNLSSYLLAGEYQAFVTSDDYLSVQNIFTFNGTGIYNLDLYMLPDNSTDVGFINIVTYKEDNTFYPEISVTALEWDSVTNTYIQTYQTFSNTNGLSTIPVILGNRIYKFCADYPSGLTCFPTSVLGVTISVAQNGETYPILPEVQFPKVPLTEGALQITINNLSLTNYSSEYYNYSVNYDWVNTLGFTSTVCTRVEKNFNFTTTTVSDTCSSAVSGSYINAFLLNKSFSYIFSIYESVGTTENEQYREYIEGDETFISLLDRFGIKEILKVLVVVIMVGIIPFMKNPLLIVADVVVAFFISWRWVVPQELSIISFGVIIIMGIITLWVVSKK